MQRDVEGPVYPMPPGGQLPDLNLAGSSLNVASGASIQAMPTPEKPALYEPQLVGSPELGGIDPEMPFYDLNLAGSQGVPTPGELTQTSQPGALYQPMYTAPDTTTPALQLANVADDGISFEPRTAFAPDPLLPDLDEYCQPHGLSIHNLNGDASGLLIPNPPVDDLLAYEVPSGLAINPHPFAADPLLPDLQHPELTLEVTMSQRPGELDPSALETLHSQPDSAQLDDASYPQVFLDQSGVNTTRRRHLDLLFRGLDAEEEGTTLDGMGTPPQPPRLSRRQRSRKGLAGDDASDNDGI